MKFSNPIHRVAWLLVACAAAFLIGCGNHDKAMPLNADNAKELFQAFQTRMGSASNPDDPALTIKVVYAAIEEDMGYSFDLTMRYKQFIADPNSGYGFGILDNLLMGSQQYIFENTDEVLKNKWISQRTYDLVQASKNAIYLYPDDEKMIRIIEECQTNHNGTCRVPELIENLIKNKMIEEKPSGEDISMYYFKTGSSLLTMGLERFIKSGLIIGLDGSLFNANSFIDEDNKKEFIINKELLKNSLQFKKMIEEERMFFNVTPTQQP